jgi:hypothetical protein
LNPAITLTVPDQEFPKQHSHHNIQHLQNKYLMQLAVPIPLSLDLATRLQ